MKCSMEKYTIYSDLHIGAPHELEYKIKYTKNTVFLGDNFDIKNTIKNELHEIESFRKKTIDRLKKVKGIYISGNHSLSPFKKNLFCVRKGILFTHGDLIDYQEKKGKKWRRKKKGVSKIFLRFLRIVHKFIKHKPILQRHIRRAYSFAKSNNVHTIVMGHFHPKRIIDIKFKDVRIIFLPRGLTKISL